MDIESDDSERWEDFFGSSTELAPSLLGIYDSLTSQLDGGQNTKATGTLNTANNDASNNSNNGNSSSSSNSSLSHEYTLHHSIEVEEYEAEENVVDFIAPAAPFEPSSHSSRDSSLTLTAGGNSSSNSSLASNSLSSLSPTNSSHSNSSSNKSRDSPAKHRNNIRILSPNVQRIITHSDAEPIEAIDIDALQLQQQQQQQSVLLSPVLQHRFVKKQPTPTLPHVSHKVKLSHIPLSKITTKLTQSGNELVETFNSSCEYLDALNFAQTERTIGRKPATPAVVSLPSSADDDKTPTNPVSPFSFDTPAALGNKSLKLTLPKQDSLKLIEMEQLNTEEQLNINTIKTTNNNAKEFIATAPLDACEMVEAINFSLVSQNIEQLVLVDQEAALTNNSSNNADSMNSSTELIEAINTPLISKPLVRSVSAACASTIAGSPLLTYARAKSMAAKANTLGGAVPIKLPTAEQLAELEEASQMSAESLDRLTDIKSKFSPKESRKMSGLMLPDIAKLKHRPLSSSSICSTSSSSSSGSDQLNGKLTTTSYLASVESLADQSENELVDPHTGMSVFERACMEIVDSERSYVEDLGQVIRGYLLDWKERACLRYDELRILFANIEEIYDFNSTLLKQLINSGMDPVKIAKCFVDLRERFDVYTTYCTSYPEAISLLTRLLQATHTNSLLTSTQKMLQHTLPLGSYLLKPVQRILKYHLLLDNLRKHCDVKEVFQAHEIMRQVARNIDQVKRKLEQQSRVKELSGILDGWLGPELTVLGELRQEGLLLEHNKPRMVFLFGTMLIITKPKEDTRLQFKSYIHQNNLMLSEHLPGEPTSFYVIPYDEPRNQIKLTAKNRDQKRLWAQHIKGVILEKFDNIPNRAKELVYKLGDEEDRTPDKNTWKWSLHSTSTPVYLERRNQYRRSEMRNRSKMKRKTVTNSTSFESFNEAAELAKEAITQNGHKTLAQNNSMDDNMLPSLQTAAKSTNASGSPEEVSCCAQAPNCKCLLRDQRSSARSSPKSPIFGVKALKERSKSVPRISLECEEYDEKERQSLHGSNSNLDARKSKSSKSVEIKQYNTKSMPKRIATLKKQRSSKKETSKFYMDLSEFETNTQTILKITESSEHLDSNINGKAEQESEKCSESVENGDDPATKEHTLNSEVTEERLTPAEKAKKDAQIILELLKNNKEFERLCKKPQKKRAHDGAASTPTSPEPIERLMELPPRPPSRSPPPLDSESETLKADTAEEEPIYESLLRNVHVPYKFSPVLGRSNSTSPYFKPRERKPQPTPRPESDYVTLIYTPEGMLKQVGEDNVERTQSDTKCNYEAQTQRDSNSSSTSTNSSNSTSSSSSCSTLKRDSQSTVISVELVASSSSGYLSQMSMSTPDPIYARPIPKNLMKRLLSSATMHTGSKSSLENVSSSEISLSRGRKSIESLAMSFGRSNKPPERRVSDVSEMCRQSIIHRQGSESVGERMAHVDYADPRTLFNMVSMNSSEASLQRDSVFSLTSSNDSVCEAKRNGKNSTQLNKFEYEENVEASLENDFRDSAIYSDDNDKRTDSESTDYIKRPSSPPPPPPPARNRNHPQVPPKPTAIPPPAGLKSPVHQLKSPLEKLNGAALGGTVIICPAHMSQSASRSWVLQQIENFNK